MRLKRHAWLLSALLVSCATSQPSTDGARATIAKQIALADEAYELGRFGTAASRYRQALLYARSQDDPKLIAPLLHNLATSLEQSDLCEEARTVFQEALDLYESIRHARGKLMSLLGRATCEHALALPGAQTSLRQVLESARQLDEKTVASRAASGLAAIALSSQSADKEELVKEAVKLADESGSHAALGGAYFNQGRLFERASQDTKAIAAFQRSAAAYRAIDDHAGLSSALARQAHLSASVEGASLETAHLFQRAAHAAASARRFQEALSAFQKAALYFDKAERPEQAKQCRERAETLKASLR
jgi:tetratricopeptide (TPR) repeat protein